jgi:hypothetical protein
VVTYIIKWENGEVYMLKRSVDDDKVKNLKTASDIVQYVLKSDVLHDDPNGYLVGNDFKPYKINTSAFVDCTLKDFGIHSPQSNMLTFFLLTKYDFDRASDVVNEIFRCMTCIVHHANRGNGITGKPLYVSIEFYAYDYDDESFLMVETFSKCYNAPKMQIKPTVVGTTQEGLYHFDEVLKLMKDEGRVINQQNGNYVLQDFPYTKTVRSVDGNEVLLKVPFAIMSDKDLKMLVRKPITMERYNSLTSLQQLIDCLIANPKRHLMWDSTNDCFKIIVEES